MPSEGGVYLDARKLETLPDLARKSLSLWPAAPIIQQVSHPSSWGQDPSERGSAFLFENNVLADYRVILLEFDSFPGVRLILPCRIRVTGVGSGFELYHRPLVAFSHQTFSPRRRRSANTDSIPRLLIILMPFVLTIKVTCRFSFGT